MQVVKNPAVCYGLGAGMHTKSACDHGRETLG